MDIVDVDEIEEIESLEGSDLFHAIRATEKSVLLSYKALAERFSDVFQSVNALAELSNDLNTLMDELNVVSSSIVQKAEAKETYASKDTLTIRKERLLTHTNMDSIVSKYVSDDDMKSCKTQILAEASKYADEITDFVGAAMVGINQNSQ